MGNCGSSGGPEDKEQRQRNKEIDAELRETKRVLSRTVKMLLVIRILY